MKVSVIICTYTHERLSYTVNAIESVMGQTYKDIEIIVVASNDEKLIRGLAAYRDKGVLITVCDQSGLSAARNFGIGKASGEIIAFLDDDAIAENYWLDEIVKHYLDKEVLAVGGNIVPKWPGNRPRWFPEELNWTIGCIYKGHPTNTCQVRNIIGCNMTFRKEIFDEIGGFSTRVGRVGKKLLAGEEVDFCFRINTRYPKGCIIYEPKALVHHVVSPERTSLGYVLRRSYNEGISKAILRKIMSHTEGGKDALGTEMGYLSTVRSKEFRRERSLSKGMVLYLAILFVVMGYVIGKFKLWVTAAKLNLTTFISDGRLNGDSRK